MSVPSAVPRSEQIGTLAGLVRALLRERHPARYGEVLDRYVMQGNDLSCYFRWNERHYTRNCILRNEHLELLVICYEPGQRTSIHDYDSEFAWVRPVEGVIHEERFALQADGRIELAEERCLAPGRDVSWFAGSSIHRFSAPGPRRAVTLNLYAGPMSRWRVYDERTGVAQETDAGPPR